MFPRRDRIATSFRWLQPRPFRESAQPSHAARYERGSYLLELKRQSLFAWEIFPAQTRHSDFALEAEMDLDEANGHSAAGLVLRHVDDENFYSFLVSTRGFFRFDLLFNNHPVHLIEWTPFLPQEGHSPARLRTVTVAIIAHDRHFTFRADDEWIGEIEDETLGTGAIGFAAQNFDEAPRGLFRLKRLVVDYTPIDVEREHLRWTYFFPRSPAARARLAETLFSQGSFSAAAVQLEKAARARQAGRLEGEARPAGSPARGDEALALVLAAGSTGAPSRERFLLAECYVRLALYDKAKSLIDDILASEPDHREARLEKANLLYLTNDFLACRDYLRSCLDTGMILSAPMAWNLLGNAEYALGNWRKSAEVYMRAVELRPEEPTFLRNAARSSELAGSPGEALELYLRAARLLFRMSDYDQLTLVMPRIASLDPGNTEVRALEAKVLYHEGKAAEALPILSDLAARGSTDSSVHYLLGLLMSDQGQRPEALSCFLRAVELEPDAAVYLFRLSEARHLLGMDPAPTLSRALELSPDDPWINNLSGLIRLESGDPAGALEPLRKAHAALASETSIIINLSEALARLGTFAEALALLDQGIARADTDARLHNQKGNLLAARGEYARAAAEYEIAIRHDPGALVYKENCAAACIEADMVHRAEELLGQIEVEKPTASVYNLLGNVAVLKGEPARAEMAYTSGLDLEPSNPDLLANLTSLHIERGHYEQAKTFIAAASKAAPPGSERIKKLAQRLRDRCETRLSCFLCGREWWVPKALPRQPAFTIRGEPPSAAPAGRCPQCGRILCVQCASPHLKDGRYQCPQCAQPLKLSDDALRWLISTHLTAEDKGGPD